MFCSCEELINIGTPSQKYPTQVGREWEYTTTWKLEYYDKTGHIDSNSTETMENTIWMIKKSLVCTMQTNITTARIF